MCVMWLLVMMAEPLLFEGAVQRTVALADPAVAVTDVGWVGAPTVTGSVSTEGGPRPSALEAA